MRHSSQWWLVAPGLGLASMFGHKTHVRAHPVGLLELDEGPAPTWRWFLLQLGLFVDAAHHCFTKQVGHCREHRHLGSPGYFQLHKVTACTCSNCLDFRQGHKSVTVIS